MIKVAAYCRVSTDGEDQANSFDAQQRYFFEYIERMNDWELFEIYADEGISGTVTNKRYHFNRMINDAYQGRFQLILTKEVSRFSRNILDTIAFTRELKAIGVGVVFVADRINTLDPEAEVLLSLFASLAQEESRRTSSRVVWGQTRQMEKGVVFGRSLLGYQVKKGAITIDPEEAETVRLIFEKYVQEEMSASKIAKFLTDHRYRTSRGDTNWSPSGIIRILRNEKYIGMLIQKKTYTPNYLTHERKRNKGDVPLICIENNHPPIIDMDQWTKAQEMLHSRNKHVHSNGGQSSKYLFSGKIKCAVCGRSFVGRNRYLKDGTMVRRWSCVSSVGNRTGACGIGTLVRDDDAWNMLKTALQHLQWDHNHMIRDILRVCCTTDDDKDTIAKLLVDALNGETECTQFYRYILQSITVFKDRHIELRFHHLPHVFYFVE